MKIISNPESLNKLFSSLLDEYKEYYWLSAWAGINSDPYKNLIKNEHKISKIVVGLHFYQTDPNFIERFLNNSNIKYIKQTDGVFHPKLFLFFNNPQDWKMIIGSANFTNAAFTKNTEISTLITSKDQNADTIFREVEKIIEKYWKEAKTFSQEEFERYKTLEKNFGKKLNQISGKYGEKEKTKRIISTIPLFKSKIASMNWETFYNKVKEDKIHKLEDRFTVIKNAREIFQKKKTLTNMTENERRFIAGIQLKKTTDKIFENIDNKIFGSMIGAGIFKKKIIDADQNISIALDEIPLTGPVIEKQYKAFIEIFNKQFEKKFFAPATRLLAMKRPDIFVCIDSHNKANLCKDFGIKKSKLNMNNYWSEIIQRIFDSDWWQNPTQNIQDKIEMDIVEARAAFLDSIYFEVTTKTL
jgi:hypothetical protein